jgi:hypothetical protein
MLSGVQLSVVQVAPSSQDASFATMRHPVTESASMLSGVQLSVVQVAPSSQDALFATMRHPVTESASRLLGVQVSVVQVAPSSQNASLSTSMQTPSAHSGKVHANPSLLVQSAFSKHSGIADAVRGVSAERTRTAAAAIKKVEA